MLGHNPIVEGIEKCTTEGIHENTIVQQKNRQINDMSLQHLTMEKMLLTHARALDDYKWLIWQIGHGNFTNVECGRGIKGILDLYKVAAWEEEEMLVILFWRLGGIWLAEIAHHALGVVQVILMFDEIAIEKCLIWDHSTNIIMGPCREHSHNIDLKFMTCDVMDEVFKAIDNDEIHYTSEATVGALSILSNDKRLYTACPILVSGTCRKENALEHSYILGTVLTAINHQQKITMLHVVSIISDGETKHGGALVLLTCKKELAPDSRIYTYLSPDALQFMNFLNLFIRPRGVTILDVHITPTIIQSHLRSEGHSEVHICELFKPNDKQDVRLTYKLLKDMWSLPETSNKKPGFAHAWNTIQILGRLCKYVLFPYICIDLSLSEQLCYLSAAKDFFPTLLFGNIMITIKNMYFCVTQAKVDTPDGQFYIILLGTNGLEKLFGILLTGTTEVTNILAQHPDWDHGMWYSSQVPENKDHLAPSSWRGDVSLSSVSLQTCW
ncbi:hypothetical protein F5146DRAFT_1106165 [Armillaria mellea]|nr:hypothetical protein F5146DRAFT_1106165 [Armillaria mellea]